MVHACIKLYPLEVAKIILRNLQMLAGGNGIGEYKKKLELLLIQSDHIPSSNSISTTNEQKKNILEYYISITLYI